MSKYLYTGRSIGVVITYITYVITIITGDNNGQKHSSR